MKKKKLILSIIAFLLVIYSIIFYNNYLTSEVREGRRNAENIKKIKIGMDTSVVLRIMGTPYAKDKYKDMIFYNYSRPPSSSEQIQIVFDSTGKVIDK